MSDCSTAAMQPKEPQTLSNCCPYCGNPTPHANAIRNRQHSVDEAIKDAWKDKQSLEQRCQQLEQVAKRLLRSVEFAAALLDGRTRYVEFDRGAIRDLRKQLEELGVDLDG